ncbi:MAG: O-antigen ligase family protein [Anaerolineales bacterium]
MRTTWHSPLRSVRQRYRTQRERFLVWLERHRNRVLQVIFVPAMLAGSALIGLIAAQKDLKYALILSLMPALIFAAEGLVREQRLATYVVLFTGLFVPLSLPTGTASRLVFSLVFTILFVALWILRMTLVDREWRLPQTPVTHPLLWFMGAVLLSWGWGIVFRDPLVQVWKSFPFVQTGSAIVMIMLPALMLLVTRDIHTEQGLKILVGIMLVGGVLGLIRQYGIARHFPVNTGGMFNLWVVVLAFGQAAFNDKLAPWQRGALLVLCAAWMYWGFFLHIDWLAGWLPVYFAVGILVFQRSKRVALALVLLTMLFAVLKSDYLQAAMQREGARSGETRLAAWSVNWLVTKEHWLFGTGPAGYAAYYMSYYPDRGMATHSNYIDIVSQLGVVGMGIILWLFGTILWTGYRLTVRLRGRGDFAEGLANAATAGTLACMLIMGFGDWLFPFAYTQTIMGYDYAAYNWIFMGTLMVLNRLYPAEEPAGYAHPRT